MPGFFVDEPTVGQTFQHAIRRPDDSAQLHLDQECCRVIELRQSKYRPNAGIVTFIPRALNQRNALVGHCKRSGLQRKKPAAAAGAA